MSRELIAAIQVDAAGAIVGNTLGFAGAPVMSGAGTVYTFPLEPDLANSDNLAFATMTGVLGGTVSPTVIAPTGITIAVNGFTTTGAGAAEARGFHLGVFRLAIGQTEGDGGIGRLNNSIRITVGEPVHGAAVGETFGITAAAEYNTGVGIYTIPLAYQINPEDAFVSVVPYLGAVTAGQVSIASMTASEIVIHTFIDMVLSDLVPFDLSTWRKAIQG